MKTTDKPTAIPSCLGKLLLCVREREQPSLVERERQRETKISRGRKFSGDVKTLHPEEIFSALNTHSAHTHTPV